MSGMVFAWDPMKPLPPPPEPHPMRALGAAAAERANDVFWRHFVEPENPMFGVASAEKETASGLPEPPPA